MERKDRKITAEVTWEANYGPGYSREDRSVTELSGTKKEADHIIQGLKVLRAQRALARASGILLDKSVHGYETGPSDQELNELIESIEQPNYVAEDEKIVEHQ